MVKSIQILIDDDEYIYLATIKGDSTWKEFLIGAAQVYQAYKHKMSIRESNQYKVDL